MNQIVSEIAKEECSVERVKEQSLDYFKSPKVLRNKKISFMSDSRKLYESKEANSFDRIVLPLKQSKIKLKSKRRLTKEQEKGLSDSKTTVSDRQRDMNEIKSLNIVLKKLHLKDNKKGKEIDKLKHKLSWSACSKSINIKKKRITTVKEPTYKKSKLKSRTFP